MLKTLKGLVMLGEKIQMIAGVLVLGTIILVMTAGIISRYVFNSPFDWTEELCTFLFIWLSFLGAGVASAKRRHVSVDFITGKLSPKHRDIVKMCTVILIIFLMILIFLGSIILLPQMDTHASVALDIPRVYFYLPILIVSFYMTVVYVVELIEIIQSLRIKVSE
ncbi:TRAP transporter small permease [Sediminispirochaeta smaragdinae]|uniref:Tripartite ATP-independent periplasmic transporter DctQ component n=1 Tax=Sediminispirochaeta smaragdinae (strain DSM 11293 / JCM 15392 / SEBR 4228) TaxID=573413 RepID=E1R9T0_SEDSS|nr:TRAP transporter small permease [Sediminispirochaeta smaragdinae]ADK83249.1 Tripartite ATP-independent periplasmic transporter DctQ component [Sediminispirochaeta smaragdinae DSM 11293]